MPKANCTEQLVQFINSTVTPSLTVNIADCTGELQHCTAQFTSLLAGGGLSEMGTLAARIMKYAASGKLQDHPATLGLMFQCVDMLERQEKGNETLRTRRKISDSQLAVVEESALLLAANGCNKEIMKTFGFSRASTLRMQTQVDQLHQQSLPCPALSIVFDSVLEHNLAIIDSCLKREEGQKHFNGHLL